MHDVTYISRTSMTRQLGLHVHISITYRSRQTVDVVELELTRKTGRRDKRDDQNNGSVARTRCGSSEWRRSLPDVFPTSAAAAAGHRLDVDQTHDDADLQPLDLCALSDCRL